MMITNPHGVGGSKPEIQLEVNICNTHTVNYSKQSQ